MNFTGKIWPLIVATVCIAAPLLAQPGRGPGGPGGPPGPGGPGGFGGPGGRGAVPGMVGGPGGYGGPGAPSGPGGPGRMSPPSFDRGAGPGQGGAPRYTNRPDMGRPEMGPGPERFGHPGMSQRTPYGHPGDQGVPATRFRSVPDHIQNPGRPPQGMDMGRAPEGMNHERGRRPAEPGGRGMPSQPDTGRMQQALRSKDYATIGRESESVRNRTERIERMGHELPVQDRLQIPLIKHLYQQGADLMEEGRSTQDDAKIRMGIQQINQANEKMNHLERRP